MHKITNNKNIKDMFAISINLNIYITSTPHIQTQKYLSVVF
jgi:hypothetical protein